MNFNENDGKDNINYIYFDFINHQDLVDLKVERNIPISFWCNNDNLIYRSIRNGRQKTVGRNSQPNQVEKMEDLNLA